MVVFLPVNMQREPATHRRHWGLLSEQGWGGRTRRWQKGVYWYIIGSVTCSSNPDSLPSRTKGPSNESRNGEWRRGNVASDRLWWISQATLSNTRWICHFQTYSFTRKHTHTYIHRQTDRAREWRNKQNVWNTKSTNIQYLPISCFYLSLLACFQSRFYMGRYSHSLSRSLSLASSSRIEYEWNKKQLKQNESLSVSLMKDERWNGSICVFMLAVFYTPEFDRNVYRLCTKY